MAIRWAQGIEKERVRARLRSDVVRAARHDIRTPIGVGKGYTNLLLTRADRLTPEQVQTSLEGLKQAFDRIQTMTDSLLVDEQLEAVGVQPQWAVLPLAPLIEEVRRDAEVVTGDPGALEVTFETGAPAELAGDRGMVREVIDNLVGNALKHAGHAGPVELVVCRSGDCARLEVRALIDLGGLTSSDVVDTALALQIVEAMDVVMQRAYGVASFRYGGPAAVGSSPARQTTCAT